MRYLYDMRSGELVKSKLFRNSLNISDSLAPKVLLSANFVDNIYASNGTNKTFAEVFTFNRAGKAWLVKDTGLVEYAVDTPRFDDGLLIEQAATNLVSLSLLPQVGFYTAGGVHFTAGRWRYNATIATGYLYPQPYPENSSNKVFSIVVPSAQAKESIGFRMGSSFSNNTSLIKNGTRVYTASGIESSNTSGLLFYLNDGAYVQHYQIEEANTTKLPTSPIVTTTAPVTRPADFLQTKVSGTTVTGDWDDTLQLSIVNGQIVHSGYGRIRSLEIN